MTLSTPCERRPDPIASQRLRLFECYDQRASRYTSYPTALDFGPAVDAKVYGDWLSNLDLADPVSLYVHMPFCARLVSQTGARERRCNGLCGEGTAVGITTRLPDRGCH
jgi:oxygen-independent coproporphyrinogen-3 oxidase